jgi:hypothetical protein
MKAKKVIMSVLREKNLAAVIDLMPAENEALPVLQLSVEQHVVTVPAVLEPVFDAVQVLHKYPLETTAPFAQTVVVLL